MGWAYLAISALVKEVPSSVLPVGAPVPTRGANPHPLCRGAVCCDAGILFRAWQGGMEHAVTWLPTHGVRHMSDEEGLMDTFSLWGGEERRGEVQGGGVI